MASFPRPPRGGPKAATGQVASLYRRRPGASARPVGAAAASGRPTLAATPRTACKHWSDRRTTVRSAACPFRLAGQRRRERCPTGHRCAPAAPNRSSPPSGLRRITATAGISSCTSCLTSGGAPLLSVDAGMLNGLYAQLLADGRKNQAGGGLSARSVRYIHTQSSTGC
jgi:hypothetical protein